MDIVHHISHKLDKLCLVLSIFMEAMWDVTQNDVGMRVPHNVAHNYVLQYFAWDAS